MSNAIKLNHEPINENLVHKRAEFWLNIQIVCALFQICKLLFFIMKIWEIKAYL